MTKQSDQLSDLFKALSDPTRRAVLHRLSRGPATTSELAKPFEMALPSFLRHLDILHECGLVRSRKVGRVRTLQLTPRPLIVVESWLAKQRKLWDR